MELLGIFFAIAIWSTIVSLACQAPKSTEHIRLDAERRRQKEAAKRERRGRQIQTLIAAGRLFG